MSDDTGDHRSMHSHPFLRGLPQLDPAENALLHTTWTPKENLSAVKVIKRGTTPGPDGLPVEFYISFRNVLTENFYRGPTVILQPLPPVCIALQREFESTRFHPSSRHQRFIPVSASSSPRMLCSQPPAALFLASLTKYIVAYIASRGAPGLFVSFLNNVKRSFE